MKKNVSVTNESSTGRNTNFIDKVSGEKMTRAGFVNKIEHGNYEGAYHVRIINGIKTPCSNPENINCCTKFLFCINTF